MGPAATGRVSQRGWPIGGRRGAAASSLRARRPAPPTRRLRPRGRRPALRALAGSGGGSGGGGRDWRAR